MEGVPTCAVMPAACKWGRRSAQWKHVKPRYGQRCLHGVCRPPQMRREVGWWNGWQVGTRVARVAACPSRRRRVPRQSGTNVDTPPMGRWWRLATRRGPSKKVG